MKKGLPKFLILCDPKDNLEGRTLVLRTEYPRYIFEINRPDEPENLKFDVQGKPIYITVLKDLSNAGTPPDTYLKEAVRWYAYSQIASMFSTFLTKLRSRSLEGNRDPSDLKYIFTWMNGAQVAQDCFKKTKAWFYQRLNGNKVNEKVAEFSAEQKNDLAHYFRERAAELLATADYLEKETDL